MKHISKAIVAFSVLTAASAVHAQTSYYGTTFDGGTGYPYTDPTVYAGGFTSIGGQGSPAWTGTPLYAVTASDGSPTGIAAQVYSGNGTAFAAHAFAPTVGGAVFNTDFQIGDNGPGNPGNSFSFNLLNSAGASVISVTFAPTGLSGGAEAAPDFELRTGGGPLFTSPNGPVIDQRYHLSINVNASGTVVATFGSAGGSSSLTTTVVGIGTGLAGLSVTETDASGLPAASNSDSVTFDNVSVVVPEPSTYAMMGLGLLGMLGLMKFRRAKA